MPDDEHDEEPPADIEPSMPAEPQTSVHFQPIQPKVDERDEADPGDGMES